MFLLMLHHVFAGHSQYFQGKYVFYVLNSVFLMFLKVLKKIFSMQQTLSFVSFNNLLATEDSYLAIVYL